MKTNKQVKELLEKLDFFRMDFAETKEHIYIMFKDNQMKISKENGKTNNDSFPTLESVLIELREW